MKSHIRFDQVQCALTAPKRPLRDRVHWRSRRTKFRVIGPANSGKTTLLKCINRTLDFIPGLESAGGSRWRRRTVTASATWSALRRRRHGLSLARRIAVFCLRERGLRPPPRGAL